MAKKSKIVLADVAREAGVSAATASAVLHKSKGNNTRFSEQTARAVRKAARKLGYRANRTFRNLNRQRHGAIGLVQAPGSYLTQYTLTSMSREAASRDLMLVMSHLEGHEPIFLKEDAVDGVLIFGHIGPKFQRRIRELGIQSLRVNTTAGSQGGTVLYDEKGGMQQAVEHLAGRGRRRLLLMERRGTGGPSHYSWELRGEGLREGCAEHGLEEPAFVELEHDWHGDLRHDVRSAEPLIEEMVGLLQAEPRPDAVILNYRILSAALYEAARRLDLDVPGDLSVVAVNTFDPIDHTYPFLSSITLDFQELGCTVVRALADIIDGETAEAPQIVFPMRFTARASS
jgi:DNA-binding LacI/PurR family transcriptional regulator